MNFEKPESLNSLLISLGTGVVMGVVTQMTNDGQNNTTNFVGGLLGTGAILIGMKYMGAMKVKAMEKLPDHLILGFAEASYLVTYYLINSF